MDIHFVWVIIQHSVIDFVPQIVPALAPGSPFSWVLCPFDKPHILRMSLYLNLSDVFPPHSQTDYGLRRGNSQKQVPFSSQQIKGTCHQPDFSPLPLTLITCVTSCLSVSPTQSTVTPAPLCCPCWKDVTMGSPHLKWGKL